MVARTIAALAVSMIVVGCTGSKNLIRSDRLDLELILIPGGEFRMGDTFEGTNDDALPVHSIRVDPFYLSRFETTMEQFDAFAKATGRPLPLPDDGHRASRAVADVSWDEANAFCFFVGGRLPTEVEWEFAAAGGNAKQKYAGTSDDLAIDEYAHHRENSGGESMPVGQKKPNVFDVYDMSGNVAEWISDYYENYPSPGEDPVYFDPGVRDMRLVRGGSVSSEAHVTRTYWRAGTLKSIRTPSVGFRCAKDAADA